jgi:uncharacterized protein (TIGR03435 family)
MRTNSTFRPWVLHAHVARRIDCRPCFVGRFAKGRFCDGPGTFLTRVPSNASSKRRSSRMTRKLARTVMIIFARAAARGQTADASPQFEVASIRLAPPQNGMFIRTTSTGGPGTPDPGLFNCENCSLSMLVMRAYDLKDYQFSGPDWTQSTRFDISAKIPAGASKEQFRLMQQNLLAERFKLAFHHEKKEMPAYELVVAKNGPKLKESVEASPPVDGTPEPPASLPPGPPSPKTDSNGFPILPPGRGPLTMVIGNGHATMRSVEESMAQLVGRLSDQVRRPVTDATGLNGKYDFTLNWVMEGPGFSTDDPGPTIFAALQDQLGLKLESKKGMVDILVVDHIEKTPTEN